jgi:hypothetical protein
MTEEMKSATNMVCKIRIVAHIEVVMQRIINLVT